MSDRKFVIKYTDTPLNGHSPGKCWLASHRLDSSCLLVVI